MNAFALRQQLIATIDELPAESLTELIIFLEYLRFKTGRVTPKQKRIQPAHRPSFLLAIADLGAAAEIDIAERDEEILTTEIDPLRGWGLPGEN